MDLIAELCESLGADVDLSIFERAGPALMHTVAREGRLLFGAPATFHRMRLRAFKEWQDSYKFLETARNYLDRHAG
jgi:hypothetical protein